MDNKTIETLSVNAVRDSIVLSDYLDQYIADNDKEPSWDGFVYIYNDTSKRKSSLRGRLAVQVKGKENNNQEKDEISFPVLTSDLTNYLYDGGVVFFVVYIDSTGTKKQIYYCELPPIKLRILLNEAQGQNHKSIKLIKFPSDSNTKAMIFFNCLSNCQKQASFCDSKLLSLKELENAGVLDGVTIPVSTVVGIDPQTALLNSEVYLYANIKGSAIPQPIEVLLQDISTCEEKRITISSNSRVFYSRVKIIRDASSTKVIIGNSFTITLSPNSKEIKMNYKGSTSARILAIDLDFMISCIESGGFNIGKDFIALNESNADLSNFNIENEKAKLEGVKRIIQVLDCLGCNKDIDVKTLSDNDVKNINCLIKAFVDKEPVSGMRGDLPNIGYLKVVDLNFLLCFMPEKDAGSYRVYDFFRMELSLYYESQDGNNHSISQYVLLHSKDFLKADNIRYETLLPSFQKSERGSDTISRANAFMLELIEAYDKDNSRKELIVIADAFAEWLMEANEDELPYEIRLLNKLQIKKRIGGLSINQIGELFKIVEKSNNREDVLVGAYLLLGQNAVAEMHFEKMSSKQQEEFKKYPIYHFWLDEVEK